LIQNQPSKGVPVRVRPSAPSEKKLSRLRAAFFVSGILFSHNALNL